MNKFREWLIRKLGGFVLEGLCDWQSDYWEREYVSGTLYVPVEHYKDSTKPDIERELATRIGTELLERNLLFFSPRTSFPDHGDIPITCSINVLRLKDRSPNHMPSRLSDTKGADKMNERKEAK